eukprot:609140-Rhodomonas_salina.3
MPRARWVAAASVWRRRDEQRAPCFQFLQNRGLSHKPLPGVGAAWRDGGAASALGAGVDARQLHHRRLGACAATIVNQHPRYAIIQHKMSPCAQVLFTDEAPRMHTVCVLKKHARADGGMRVQALSMLFMGMTLELDDFRRVLKNPSQVSPFLSQPLAFLLFPSLVEDEHRVLFALARIPSFLERVLILAARTGVPGLPVPVHHHAAARVLHGQGAPAPSNHNHASARLCIA